MTPAMKNAKIYLSLSLVFLLLGCNTTKPVRPMESYEEGLEPPVSMINIPIDIEVRELEAALNEELEGVLYEDNDLSDGDKMMIRAEKSNTIRLGVEEEAIKYRLPLKLWIKYDLGISKVEAEGDITIDFKTEIELTNQWEVITKTSVLEYKWDRKPRVKLGFVDLPVGFIADLVLRNSKEMLTTSIDELVKDNFNLRGQVEEAWSLMFKPTLVSEEYSTWLTINPEKIGMTPIKMEPGKISSLLFIEGRPSVKVGAEPLGVYPKPLPDLLIQDSELTDFTLFLNTDISYDEAERLAKREIVGETFSQGKRSVTITNLEMYGQGNRIVVNTYLQGSYNGSIYLTGEPVYDSRKNTLDIKNLEYTLDTKNFLFKSAGWLLKSSIKNQIQDNLNFLMDYNLKEMQKQFQEQLREYKVSEGVTVFGDLAEMNLQNAYLSPKGMVIQIGLKGNINVKVTGLN
jgi:hypothetical protein